MDEFWFAFFAGTFTGGLIVALVVIMWPERSAKPDRMGLIEYKPSEAEKVHSCN